MGTTPHRFKIREPSSSVEGKKGCLTPGVRGGVLRGEHGLPERLLLVLPRILQGPGGLGERLLLAK